jgi:hypothetical protein
MVKVLQQLLGRPVKWGLESRLRCFADIANRVITALLFGTKEAKITKALEHSGADEQFIVWNELDPLGKLHNICVYINCNDERRGVFRRCQVAEQGVVELAILNLIQDGGIRWHSTYDMIERGKKSSNYSSDFAHQTIGIKLEIAI